MAERDARRALSVQSGVVAGHVGHGASAPALALLGVEAATLPTVLLSGHAATPGVAGRRLPGEEIAALAGGLAAAGALARADGLLTGYLGTVGAAEAVADLAERWRAARGPAGGVFLCDPVLGDAGPGLYLPAEVGEVYRARLLPLADVATPNLFELGWLTGAPTGTPGEVRAAAEALRGRLRPGGAVVVTSVEAEGGIGALAVGPEGASLATGAKAARHLHGAGDFVAAVILAELLAGRGPGAAAARAVAAASALAAEAAARGRDDLPVVHGAARWLAARGEARALPGGGAG